MEYIISGLFIIGYGWLAMRNTSHALYVLIFLLPTYLIRFTFGPFPTTLLEMLTIVLVGTWFYKNYSHFFTTIKTSILEAHKPFTWSYHNFFIISIFLFFISSILAMSISPKPLAAFGIWKAYFLEPLLVFFIVTQTLKTTHQKLIGISSGIVSALGVSLYALIQYASEGMRATSIYPYPNAVGLFVGPLVISSFILALYYIQEKIHRQNGIFFLCACMGMMGGIGVAQTESMAGVLGIAILLVLLIHKGCARYVGVLTGLGVAGILILNESLRSFLFQKLFLKDWSGFVHMSIWKETYHMLQDHWLTGAGLAGYQELFKQYHTTKGIEIFLYPHNIIMNFWSELGFFGLISFLLLLISFVVLMIVALKQYPYGSLDRVLCCTVLFSIGVMVIHGLVDVPYFKNDLALQFWILLGIGFSLYTTSREVSPPEAGQALPDSQ